MTESRSLYTSEYYGRLIAEHQYNPFDFKQIDFGLGKLTQKQMCADWLCHLDADEFALRMGNGEPSIVCTGIGLSGEPHMGTVGQIMRAIKLQKAGVEVQLVLGDLDAINGKNTDIGRARELALRYKSFIIGLGFKDTGSSVLRNQWDDTQTLRNDYLLARFMDTEMFAVEEDLHAYYAAAGKVDPSMTYARMRSLALMATDFLGHHWRAGGGADESGGRANVCVSLGVDEHVYVKFAQSVLRGMKSAGAAPENSLMAAMYTPIIPGLYDPATKAYLPKMSKSFPTSGITAGLSPDEIRDRIILGEGLRDSPEENPIYLMLVASSELNESDLIRARKACVDQGDEWARIKQSYAEYLIEEIFSKWP